MSYSTVDRTVIILAAGAGTRMRSTLPKVLHPIAGRPMLQHVIDVAHRLAARQTCVVVSPTTISAIQQACGPQLDYAIQTTQRGTADAVSYALPLITAPTGDAIILFGDTPLITAHTIEQLIQHKAERKAAVCIMSFDVPAPHNYGRIVRDAAGHVTEIVEAKNCTPEQQLIREANSGIMVVDVAWLHRAIPRITPNALTNELYLTDIVALANADFGVGAALALSASDASEAWGINNRAQLAHAEALLQTRVINTLWEQGVTIIDPKQVLIAPEAQIGADTVIWPGSVITGQSVIASHCHIGPHATIHDSHIGEGSQVAHAYVRHSTLPAYSQVAPFSTLIEDVLRSHTNSKEEAQSQD
jgi:bifunctional UDP-N-acetylglucosamine pyrophosphorylase/glucosamine-1-phosphate N-acetyltransferase